MSLYYITIGKKEYNVNLDNNFFLVNGRPVSAHLKCVNKLGLHVLQRGKKAIELYLNSADGDNLEVLVAGQRVLAKVETQQKRACKKEKKETSSAVVAPMPGVLVNVLVGVGDEVKEGQTLAVLESMKMQMQLRTLVSGKVSSVFFQAGDQIEKGKEIIQVKDSEAIATQI